MPALLLRTGWRAVSYPRQKPKKPDRTADTTGWILGTTIVVLATIDLLVWASLNNVPNPISKTLANYTQAPPRVLRTAAH